MQRKLSPKSAKIETIENWGDKMQQSPKIFCLESQLFEKTWLEVRLIAVYERGV